MKKQHITSISILLIMTLALFVSGCGGQPVYSNNPQNNSVGSVQTLGEAPYFTAKNWDADPEIDGLEFDLSPQNRNNELVKANGTVSVKLWKEVEVDYVSKCLKRAEDLLETWSVPVTENDYGFDSTTIRVEYQKYKISNDEYATGCAEVTFTTLDGKNFTVLSDGIYING